MKRKCSDGASCWLGSPISALAMVVTMVILSSASAQELTVQDIVDKSLSTNSLSVSDAISKVSLTLVSKRGTKRVRKIEIRSIEVENKNRTLVRFDAPADVAGTGFLRRDLEGGGEEQYLYLPALGKVKRITGNQRNQRFMGTDLTYSDLENGNLKDAELKRLPDAKLGNSDVYVIEAVPNNGAESSYGKTISWIHKKSFVPLQVEFYDKKFKLLKKLKVKRLEKKQGNWVAMDSKIVNVQKNTQTLMVVNSIQFNVKLRGRDFTQRALSGG